MSETVLNTGCGSEVVQYFSDMVISRIAGATNAGGPDGRFFWAPTSELSGIGWEVDSGSVASSSPHPQASAASSTSSSGVNVGARRNQ